MALWDAVGSLRMCRKVVMMILLDSLCVNGKLQMANNK